MLTLGMLPGYSSPFITTTYELVDDSAYDNVISWNDDGSSFIVWQSAEFARYLLPFYFDNLNNFSSFVRELNAYGFRKVVPYRWEFANDSFKRGQKQLLCRIRPLASKVTLGDDDSSEMLPPEIEVGISEDTGTFSSLTSISAVSSNNDQHFMMQARRASALRMAKREKRKSLRNRTEQFSGETLIPGDSSVVDNSIDPSFLTLGENSVATLSSISYVGENSIDLSFPLILNSIGENSIRLGLSSHHPHLNPPMPGAKITQDSTIFGSQPLSLTLHSPLGPALPYDGMMIGDALRYCALFSSHHEFEKDTLIHLWMADGVVLHEPMEKIAGLFFDSCITKGYFQFSRSDLVTGNALYKLDRDNDLVSSLISRATHIVRIEGDSNLNNVSPEVPHVSIMCGTLKDSIAFHDFKRLGQLRTLMFLQAHKITFKQLPRDFFLLLRLLRVLDLSRMCLMELPSSIGCMKCLCYLDLSETPIKRLPEAMSCLENLQTLKLKGCLKLSAVPKGMRKMASLRHLDFDVLHQIHSMPEGMGALTNIQTLSAFLVGVEEGCSIRQLKNMNSLSGSFCISRLENVLTKNEAEEACLSDKSELKKLELHWSDTQYEDIAGYGEVLYSLQPNTSLEELLISCYGGFELPSWICDLAFSELVSVSLFECENCLVLPSLGQLPSLKFLYITDFHKLEVIDYDFYGGLGISGYVAFPKLENLTLENMSNLEEWLVYGSFDFPRLIKLTIKHCPKLYSLRTLSCLSSLENLEISHCTMLASCLDGKLPAGVETFIVEDCPLITAKFLKYGSQDWVKVAHIPHVWIDHQEMAFGLRSS